jgi:hypothetical protein
MENGALAGPNGPDQRVKAPLPYLARDFPPKRPKD